MAVNIIYRAAAAFCGVRMQNEEKPQGLEAAGGTPEKFGAFIKSEIAKYAKVVKAAGIRAE